MEIFKLLAGVLVMVVSAAILILAVRAAWRGMRSDDAETRDKTRTELRDVVIEALVYLLILAAGATWVLMRYNGTA